MEWRERDGVVWLEARLPKATAAFSSRLGGHSPPPFESLNLGLLTGDDQSSVRANRALLVDALRRDPEQVLIGHQVHDRTVLRGDRAARPNPFLHPVSAQRADGQATDNPVLTPTVQVADCLPVMLAGRAGVAALHCGWRGLAAGIVDAGVRATAAYAAAVGPGIGACCYAVGKEVLAAFEPLGEGVAAGSKLDLAEVTRRLLRRAGVAEVEVSGLCTSCEPELFFSHRRDGERTGRQAGLVWRHPDA
jgi:YfiH family protein